MFGTLMRAIRSGGVLGPSAPLPPGSSRPSLLVLTDLASVPGWGSELRWALVKLCVELQGKVQSVVSKSQFHVLSNEVFGFCS